MMLFFVWTTQSVFRRTCSIFLCSYLAELQLSDRFKMIIIFTNLLTIYISMIYIYINIIYNDKGNGDGGMIIKEKNDIRERLT